MTPKGHFEMNWCIKTRNLELHNAIWQEKIFLEFTFEYLLTRRIEDLVLVLSFKTQKSLEKLNFLFDQQMIYLKVEKKISFFKYRTHTNWSCRLYFNHSFKFLMIKQTRSNNILKVFYLLQVLFNIQTIFYHGIKGLLNSEWIYEGIDFPK